MKLLSLHVKNAFSFGEIDINFSELNSHTQITGINFDEDFSGTASNGSGKTSIVLCILQALYGKDIKNTKKDNIANFSINAGYSIRVCFTEKESKYKVVNTRNARGKSTVSLYKNSVDISAHTIPDTYKLIQSIIGIDYTLFTKLIYQSSNNYLDFLSITDSERKKLLTNLFNLDRYSGYITTTKARLAESNKFYKAESAVINKLLTEIKIVVENKIRLKDKPISADYKNAITSLKECTIELNSIDTINTSIRKSKTCNEALHGYIEPILVQEPNECEIRTLQEDLFTKIADCSRHKKEISLYNKKPSVCRLCKQPVDNGFNEGKLVELRNRILIIEARIQEINSKLSVMLNNKKQYETYIAVTENHMSMIATLDTSLCNRELLDIESCKMSVRKYKGIIDKYERDILNIDDYNSAAIAHNSKQDTLKEIQDAAKVKYKSVLISAEKLKIAVSTETLLLTALQKLLVYKLENMVLALQNRVNKYVQKLYTIDIGLLISLNKDKLVFKLIKDGSEVEVNSLSSGELSRIQVSILFSIRDVLQSMSGVDVNILILDEILSSLDEPGREKLYSMLEETPYKVLSISHSYKDNRLDCLTIEKKKGISTIKEIA